MKLYDGIIKSIEEIIDGEDKKILKINSSWREGDKNQLIFKSDSQFELGGGNLPGISGILFTDNEKFNEDQIVLIGEDLPFIKGDNPYARLVIVRVDNEKMGEGNTLYQNIRKIDYTRYHINLEGFLMRISSMNKKESVIVSKKAIKDKISFESIGKNFIDAYKKNKAIKNVKIIFITKKDFDYSNLNNYLIKSEDITKALDHLMNKVTMDCHSCKLQMVCKEVEELCKEDFHK